MKYRVLTQGYLWDKPQVIKTQLTKRGAGRLATFLDKHWRETYPDEPEHKVPRFWIEKEDEA